MPPEQAAGAPVDERADVYAIGALLHNVLAGAPPYRGASGSEILAAVLGGPPEALPDTVPADLAAIVARAMARAPADRYPTGKALAEDLRRFQTGQLVGAHRYTTVERIRRWVRRHRAVVAVTAIAAVLATAGGTFAVRRILRERATAEHQRALAEARGADAEELAAYMLNNVHEQLAALDRLDLLEPIARAAIASADRAAARGDPPSYVHSQAHLRLGEVLHFRGDLAGAEAEHERALAIIDAVLAAAPDDEVARRQRAIVLQRIGDARHAQGDTGGAVASYRAALEMSDDALVRRSLGSSLVAHGDLDGAAAEYTRAHAIAHALVATKPEDPDARAALAGSQTGLGDVLHLRGDDAAALVQLEEAHRLYLGIAADAPEGRTRRAVELSHLDLARVRIARGDRDGGLREREAALAIARDVAAADPGRGMWQDDLARAESGVGDLLIGTDDAGARAHLERALAIRETLVARDPGNVIWQDGLAITHDRLFNLAVAADDVASATAHARASLDIRAALVAAHPADDDLQGGLGVSHTKLARALIAAEDLAGAIDVLAQGRAIFARLATAAPTVVKWKQGLSVCHNMLGHARWKLHDHDGALRELRADLAIAEELAALDPASTAAQEAVAKSRVTIANVERERDLP